MSVTVAVLLTLATVGFALYVGKSVGFVRFARPSKFLTSGSFEEVGQIDWGVAEQNASTNGGRVVDIKSNDKIKVRQLLADDGRLLGTLVFWPNRTYAYLDTGYSEMLLHESISAYTLK